MSSFVLAAGAGGVRELAPDDPGIAAEAGFVWQHVELADDETLALKWRETIPEVVLTALGAAETRPRCEQFGDGALINLRGPALEPETASDKLVSIRIWSQRDSVVTVSRRSLSATPDVVAAMRAGQLTDPGDLVAAFARRISNELDPQVAALGDSVDDCETEMEQSAAYRLRQVITVSRSEAIAFRRFIAPDRDALAALAGLRVEWLSDEDRLHVREAADRFARMAEELDAVRERSALLHEQLTDLRAELVEERSLSIAVVAFVFLPLTFITGLLGMNVEGIPYAMEPWAFGAVVALCVVLALAVFGWFLLSKWLKR